MKSRLVLPGKGSLGNDSLNRFIKETLPGIKSPSKIDFKEFFTYVPEILDSQAYYIKGNYLGIVIYLPLGINVGIDDETLLEQEKIISDSLERENYIGLKLLYFSTVFRRFDSKRQTTIKLHLEVDTKEFITRFSDKDCTLRIYVALCLAQILMNGHFDTSHELSVILKDLYKRTLKGGVVKRPVVNNPMKIITI